MGLTTSMEISDCFVHKETIFMELVKVINLNSDEEIK